MKTDLTKGKEVINFTWEREDICNILSGIISDQGFDIKQKHFDILVNKVFIWMDSLNFRTNPPSVNSIISYIENTLLK